MLFAMESTRKFRPVPVIENELSFSRKKKSRDVHNLSQTPKSPAKTAPPVSRIFRNRATSTPGACPVSFRQSQIEREVNIQSPLYTNFNKLYFDQCFTKLSFLGSGSFGLVVKVQSKEDGKLYAVKKSRERFRSDTDRKNHLEEVNKNEQIKVHCNCVRFYKAWEERDYLYIQTELCEMSLKDYAESVQSIEEKEIWNIIVDLSIGLKHLHDVNLAHMDIKPANLFLGRDGLYKIGDFGLVVELTRDLNDAMDGDSKYLAPELMEGKFSKAADIFSLGITILELACSLELPRGGSLWHQLRHNELPLEFTQGLSDDLIILVSNMMDRNPENRPTINDILKKPCFIQARRIRQHSGSQLIKTFLPFMYFFGLLYDLFYSFLNFIKGVYYDRSVPRPSHKPTSTPNTGRYDLTNVDHDSLNEHYFSSYTPTSFKGKYSTPVSPVFKDSPSYQPLSHKREMDMWKMTPPDHTPRNYSAPRPENCSPCLSPVSDRAVRSKLFNYSDDEEEINAHSLSINLMKVFDQENDET